jgi:hypothetical protein
MIARLLVAATACAGSSPLIDEGMRPHDLVLWLVRLPQSPADVLTPSLGADRPGSMRVRRRWAGWPPPVHERVGMGIREAPRDALVADRSPEAFARSELRIAPIAPIQSGHPLAAIGPMVLIANNFTAVFWIALVPAFLAFGLMIFGVKEPTRHEAERPRLACIGATPSGSPPLSGPSWQLRTC